MPETVVVDPLARQRALVAQHPQNELARFSLGKALYDRGDLAGAREHLAAALARRGDWMVVQILLGKIEHAAGNFAGARDAFARARQMAVDQNHEGPLAELDQLLAELPAC